MRCQKCGGTGLVPFTSISELVSMGFRKPCPRCGGSGVDHCCDGIVAHAEVEDESD